MSVAVIVESKHGSTYEIGEHLASVLRAIGLDAAMYTPADAPQVGDQDAVIIGSGVYAGQWLPEARRFLGEHAEALRALPVWLFSSGPIGELAADKAINEKTVKELLATVKARDHRLFPGKLDRADLSRGERLIVRAVRAPEGDFRDFDAVTAWANEIAGELAVIQESGHVTA